MVIELTMPKLSPTMEEGTVVKWHKQVGDFVEPGDLLLEIATDKATVEHNAIDRGWLRKVFVEESKEAEVNQVLAIITETKDESIDDYQLPKKKTPIVSDEAKESSSTAVESTEGSEAKASAKTTGLRQPAFVPENPLEDYEFEFPRRKLERRLFASPLARKIAKEKGLDLSTVKGSGPRQRIMKRDLEKARPLGKIVHERRSIPQDHPGSFEEVALSPMRKAISRRLQEAKTFIPHFYVTKEIDAEPLMNMYEQLKKGGLKISLNDCVVRACALALRNHMEINAGYNSVNQTIIQFTTVDIAIAVSAKEGLYTPIVRHADFKSLGELSVEIKQLARKAKKGKLLPHEYKGGSFTISNLGMYGVTDFQAIINPPQAAILAVSAVRELPVIKKGQLAIGSRMNITLSVDHRVIDGAAAAIFLQAVQSFLESPALLLDN